jgi:DNA mismatch repair protein MutS2
VYFDNTFISFENLVFSRTRQNIETDLITLDILNESRDDYFSKIFTLFNYFPQKAASYDFIDLIKKAYDLDIDQLNISVNLLELNKELNNFLPLKQAPLFIHYFENFILPNDIQSFMREFRKYVKKDGSRSFENHPELNQLYKELYEIEGKIRAQLAIVISELASIGALQFKEHDVIYDRFVIAVRSDSYSSKYGSIISRSASGQTLYVEPHITKQMANRRMEILSAIDEIIYKITKGYSTVLHRHYQLVENSFSLLTDLDIMATRMRIVSLFGLQRQTLNSQGVLEISNFYHPLIKDCVKNSVVINGKSHGLIISGPNTGGKSVALKSIAIVLMFHHLGMYVPASHANIPDIDQIHYFSNDQQNLTEGLSSFSSEISSYIKLLKNISQNSFVFIDEVLNTTSSEEASALAVVILEELKKINGVKIFISTHHQLLKTLIHQNEDFLSAHVGFDEETEKPTFKIYYGSPGSSMAIKIFKHISDKQGLSSHLYQRAEQIIGKKEVLYEQLLAQIAKKNAELDSLIKSNNQLNQELKNKKKAMEGLLFLEKQNLVAEAKKEIDVIVNKSRDLFEQINSQKIETKRQLEIKAQEAKQALQRFTPRNHRTVELDNRPVLNFEDLKVNETYYSNQLRAHILVKELDNRKELVKIAVNGKTMVMPANALLIQKSTSKEANQVSQKNFVFNYTKDDSGKIEIDCRGMRLDDFIKACEDSFADLMLEKIPFITIVHGHGDGILKKWLRDYLRKEPNFTWDTPEGNDGCTRVKLR